MKVLKLLFLFFTFITSIFMIGCEGGLFGSAGPTETQRVIEQDIGSITSPDCSLSSSPTLQTAVNINNRLQSMVENADVACQSAVAALNFSNNTIQAISSDRLAANDWANRLRDIEAEIDYLTSINNNGIYDDQIAALNDRKMNASSQLRRTLTAIQTSEVENRVQAINELGDTVSLYQNVLSSCQNADPRAISSIAGSALNFASALGGYSGGSALAANLMMQVVQQIGSSITTFTERLSGDFQNSRLPASLVCAIESVSRGYCEAVKQIELRELRSHHDQFLSSCTVDPGVDQFDQISELMPHLRELFQETQDRRVQPDGRQAGYQPGQQPMTLGGQQQFPGVTPAPGGDNKSGPGVETDPAPVDPAAQGDPQNPWAAGQQYGATPQDLAGETRILYERRIRDLSDDMEQIIAYRDTLQNYTEQQEGDSDLVIGSRSRLAETLETINGAIENARTLIRNQAGDTELMDFFTNDNNNLQLLLERASVHHETIMVAELEQQADRNQRSEANTDYNFAILANASARITGTSVMNETIRLDSRISEELIQGDTPWALNQARHISRQSMSGLDEFLQSDRVNMIETIEYLRSRQTASGASAEERESSGAIIQQLCAMSLSIYQSGMPSEMNSLCQDFNQIPGRSFTEVSSLPWEERACIINNMGIIGQ